MEWVVGAAQPPYVNQARQERRGHGGITEQFAEPLPLAGKILPDQRDAGSHPYREQHQVEHRRSVNPSLNPRSAPHPYERGRGSTLLLLRLL
jgi:hypothetical protein